MATNWYCYIDGAERGPMSSAQLKDLAARKVIHEGTPVRRETDTAWSTAGQISNLFATRSPAPSEPPPLPGPEAPVIVRDETRKNAAPAPEPLPRKTPQRYGALGIISSLYRAFGILLLIFGSVVAIVTLVDSLPMGLLTLTMVLMLSLSAIAAGELIQMGRDIEQNTHTTAELCRHIAEHASKGNVQN